MVRELREALDDHQFEVLYQPQVNLNSSAIISYEALLRWRHPLRGLIEPQDFMRSAESSGLIIPIGCQWPRSSPRRRPVVLPAGGHGFSPVAASCFSP
ncbi:EAL domain-containing protein, partial [Rhodococcus sp. 27YEA6]|uniref:EAL domain-containing protein n=1 Tax=Rhodococcus sp. 27YEA6 TaxID=3156273 RepID=UPI0038327093